MAVTIIGAGIVAGGALAASSKASKASKNAAKTQAGAASEATDIQYQQYLQSRQDLAPARQQGNYALQQMSHLMGLPTYQAGDQTFEGGAQGGYSTPGFGQPEYGLPGGWTPGNGVGGEIFLGAGFSGIPGPQNLDNGPEAAIPDENVGRLDVSGDKYRGFTESPGYQFAFDEAMRGAGAAASAGGYLGSGRAAKASAQYAQGLASQEYNNYFNQLGTIAGTGSAATSQTANAAFNFGQQAGYNAIRAGDARASGLVGSANAWGQGARGVAQAGAWAIGQEPWKGGT